MITRAISHGKKEEEGRKEVVRYSERMPRTVNDKRRVDLNEPEGWLRGEEWKHWEHIFARQTYVSPYLLSLSSSFLLLSCFSLLRWIFMALDTT